DVRETANQGLAVQLLELVEFRTIDQPRDDVAHIVRLSTITSQVRTMVFFLCSIFRSSWIADLYRSFTYSLTSFSVCFCCSILRYPWFNRSVGISSSFISTMY